MREKGLYDTDVYAWSEQQADALRALAGRRDLPNGLDLANVVEEIEDVGKSEFRSVESFIINILSHLLLSWASPAERPLAHWANEVIVWRSQLRRRITPAMRGRLDLDDRWRDAARMAAAKFDVSDEPAAAKRLWAVAGTRGCPFSLDDLCAEDFSVLDAIRRVGDVS